MGKLILIEGIPGSGKTTLSQMAAEYLSKKKKTSSYEEGAAHPADLAWCACIPTMRFEEVLSQYPAYEDRIKQVMYQEGDYYIVPYTRFQIEDPKFYSLMESFEVYDNRVGVNAFMDLHLKKWINFAKQSRAVDENIVFECAFLQNHINELLLFHCSEKQEIKEYLLRLISTVKELKPVLIYLNQPDVGETLRRVAEERINEKGEQIWCDRVIEYIQNAPYGKKLGLSGFEGMITYFDNRKQLELNILQELLMETYILDNEEYQWDIVWEKLKAILDTIE